MDTTLDIGAPINTKDYQKHVESVNSDMVVSMSAAASTLP